MRDIFCKAPRLMTTALPADRDSRHALLQQGVWVLGRIAPDALTLPSPLTGGSVSHLTVRLPQTPTTADAIAYECRRLGWSTRKAVLMSLHLALMDAHCCAPSTPQRAYRIRFRPTE